MHNKLLHAMGVDPRLSHMNKHLHHMFSSLSLINLAAFMNILNTYKSVQNVCLQTYIQGMNLTKKLKAKE